MYRISLRLLLPFALLFSCVSEKVDSSEEPQVSVAQIDLTQSAKRLIDDCLNPQNAELISTFYHDDIVFHAGVGQQAKGHDAILEVFKFYQSNYPGMRYTIEDMFQSGEKVVVRWTSVLDPSDTVSVQIPGISILGYRDGKVKEIWQEWDKSLLQQ